MSPHEKLLSASGLRPMSAFVVVAAVVFTVAVWVVRLSTGGAEQPRRLRSEQGLSPAYSILARDGEAIARFVPRFDLELSPRSLWQAHTPWRIATAVSEVLGGRPSPRELLDSMLPDADERGWVAVDAWQLSPLQAQRIHDWIESGAGSELGPLSGFRIEPGPARTYRLRWLPEVALSAEERSAHGVPAAWRWARRLADGLHTALHDVPLDPAIVSENEARRAREAVWKALLPTAFARPLTGISPDHVLPLRTELEKQGIAPWQMRVVYARDRVYPAGEHELFGSWGYVGPEATEPAPREGLERLCDRLLADPRFAFFERTPESYSWVDDRPARGARSKGYLAFTPASEPVAVRTTIDLALQRFMGQELRAALDEHRAAVAMGIVLDVASGEVLAVDSVEAYPIQPFAPVYHTFTTGSTFKVLTMAAALDEGVVDPQMKLDVGDGQYRVVYPDGRPSGRVIGEAENALTGSHTVQQFFAHSVNAALAQVALRMEDVRFHGYLERLGYGRAPEAGLGPERSGSLPSPPWSYAYTHASMGFGHEISTTLWRHAEGLATVVRGGEHLPLTLLRDVGQGERRVRLPGPPPERVFSARSCALVRDMMRLGALEGSGRECRAGFVASVAAALGREPAPDELDLGTKTGTAQKVPTELCVHVELGERARWEEQGLAPTNERIESLKRLEKPHRHCYTSSICAFGKAPGSERELMVLVVVDEPRGKEKYGGKVAGPAAQRILAEALGLTVNGRAPDLEVAPGFGALDVADLGVRP